jgi:hypothetical protein
MIVSTYAGTVSFRDRSGKKEEIVSKLPIIKRLDIGNKTRISFDLRTTVWGKNYDYIVRISYPINGIPMGSYSRHSKDELDGGLLTSIAVQFLDGHMDIKAFWIEDDQDYNMNLSAQLTSRETIPDEEL